MSVSPGRPFPGAGVEDAILHGGAESVVFGDGRDLGARGRRWTRTRGRGRELIDFMLLHGAHSVDWLLLSRRGCTGPGRLSSGYGPFVHGFVPGLTAASIAGPMGSIVSIGTVTSGRRDGACRGFAAGRAVAPSRARRSQRRITSRGRNSCCRWRPDWSPGRRIVKSRARSDVRLQP